jgi:hypothetical protein
LESSIPTLPKIFSAVDPSITRLAPLSAIAITCSTPIALAFLICPNLYAIFPLPSIIIKSGSSR